jgi:signal peptidase I
MPLIVRWFISKTVRQAVALRKHVWKILNHQRDILQANAISEVESAMADLQTTIRRTTDRKGLEKQMERLEEVANKWLKPYPNATARENVEVLLVALAVAMGIRTFFLQPFKIPTGSMQPTLFGVTSVPDFTKARSEAEAEEQGKLRDGFSIPAGLERVKHWFQGISYLHLVADRDGTLDAVEPPLRIAIFNIKQRIRFAGESHTLWFPPDYGLADRGLEARAGIRVGQSFRRGEDIFKLKIQAGDHLFVDRVTYNFRPPTRGEIIVFETKNIVGLPQDQFYIKRMVALGNERVQIGNDRHLVIDGKRLDSSTPHFENVYSFNPKEPPQESHYSGHVNQKVAQSLGSIAPLFPDGSVVRTIPAGHYMVMGDNTMNSFDSRGWGAFPATNVIGKSFFVYWPITDRFGWGHR